jgi:ferric-dicitrate binding protein FerR (iron transport regulator)
MSDPRVREWLLRWEEGDLSPAEIDKLADLLKRDPQARQELRLHSMISAGIGQSLARPLKLPSPWRRVALAGVAAAALIATLATTMLLRRSPPPTPENPPAAVRRLPPPEPEQPPKIEEEPAPAPKPIAPPVEPVRPPVVAPPPEIPKPPTPEVPEPKPVAPPAPAPKALTVAVLATLERVTGRVFVVADGSKSPATSARKILAGQGLETEGAAAEAIVAYPDATRLTFGADARVVEFSDAGAGKRITLGRGTLAIDLVGQTDSRPLVVQTAQAEVRSAGGYFVLSCDAESTRVDVGAGKVRVNRVTDGRSLEISGGQFANVTPGSDFTLRPLLRQDKKKKGKKDLEFELKVNTAIRNGVAFLGAEAAEAVLQVNTTDAAGGYPVELVLWALERGGLPESDPTFQRLFQHMTGNDPRWTYKVALQAMILEELDRVKYQGRLAGCAQFLVDNQARNGQWSYGDPVALPDLTPGGGKARKDVATAGGGGKPKVVQKIAIAKRRDGPVQGDNSNSQYAALGLRACHDAGIVIPPEVVKRAMTWWRDAQAAGKKTDAAGWTYGEAPAPGGRVAYGSMTAGAAGSLVMYHYILGEAWTKDDSIQKGMEWMSRHFTVTENPYPDGQAKDERWPYYYLYALERLGILYGTETFGGHDWYAEGANVLLKAQKPDGSWTPQAENWNRTVDTCFAILFLRRATRPLIDVASVDKDHSK